MTHSILKTLAIALAASGIAASASASSMEEKFDVTFTIDSSWTVAETYAEFVGLDSNNHLLLSREPASADFVSEFRRFLMAS